MLALAYAAAHPKSAGPLVLVGCGTFDLASRARFKATLDERMGDALKARIAALEREIPDANRRLAAFAGLLSPVYDHDPLPDDLGFEGCDARAHDETWSDMLRLQADGTYPAAFAGIESPVLMIHGAFDPHPGPMIARASRPTCAASSTSSGSAAGTTRGSSGGGATSSSPRSGTGSAAARTRPTNADRKSAPGRPNPLHVNEMRAPDPGLRTTG